MRTISEFQRFSDSLREQSEEMRRAAPRLLEGAGDELPPNARASLVRASSMLESTLVSLEAAAEEMQVQNDALFDAHVEMESEGQFYRQLFDLAPAACLVTSPEAQITHANVAATCLFGRPTNALVGRLLVGLVELPERGAFRAGLARTLAGSPLEEWPIRFRSVTGRSIDCRVRVSARRDGARARTLHWMISEDGAADDDLL